MSSIKCGNCTNVHATVAEVRACYGQPAAAPATGRAADQPKPAKPVTPAVPATERQVNFIQILAGERGVQAKTHLSKREASDEIARLLALPKPQPTVAIKGQTGTVAFPPADVVPAGRYAVRRDGVVKFYKVDRPTEGRWADRVFVKVQASDDLHPVRGSAAVAVVKAVAEAGAKESSALYGHELGACGVCGRTLTDETSRANGIGPVCITKMGW